ATLFLRHAIARLAIATLCLAALIVAIGLVSTAATPPGSTVARITPGGGFWVLFAVIGLVISDPHPGRQADLHQRIGYD
ncbi:hypothetical protein ACC796_36890, partial [Rhizobium ruizarguesonis]